MVWNKLYTHNKHRKEYIYPSSMTAIQHLTPLFLHGVSPSSGVLHTSTKHPYSLESNQILLPNHADPHRMIEELYYQRDLVSTNHSKINQSLRQMWVIQECVWFQEESIDYSQNSNDTSLLSVGSSPSELKGKFYLFNRVWRLLALCFFH